MSSVSRGNAVIGNCSWKAEVNQPSRQRTRFSGAPVSVSAAHLGLTKSTALVCSCRCAWAARVRLESAGNQAMKSHFAMMADYNAWANGRLYGMAHQLPDEQYRRNAG